MSDDRFRQAENQYRSLSNRLARGEIALREFNAAREALSVTDSRGRSWRLGENGKWYLRNRVRIVLPPSPPDAVPGDSATVASGRSQPATIGRLFGIGLFCLLCIGDIVGLGLVFSRSYLGSVPAAVAGVLPPVAGSMLPMSLGNRSDPNALAFAPATLTVAAPAAAPSVSPERTPAPKTRPNLAPGLYATSLRTNPPVPRRQRNTTFWVTFLNTSGSVVDLQWQVYLYRAADPSRPIGQTVADQGQAIPAGTVEEQSRGSWQLTGTGPCEVVVARIISVGASSPSGLMHKPTGEIFEQPFAICP